MDRTPLLLADRAVAHRRLREGLRDAFGKETGDALVDLLVDTHTSSGPLWSRLWDNWLRRLLPKAETE